MKIIKQRKRKIRKGRTRILMQKRTLRERVSVALILELKKLVQKMKRIWTRILRGIVIVSSDTIFQFNVFISMLSLINIS